MAAVSGIVVVSGGVTAVVSAGGMTGGITVSTTATVSAGGATVSAGGGSTGGGGMTGGGSTGGGGMTGGGSTGGGGTGQSFQVCWQHSRCSAASDPPPWRSIAATHPFCTTVTRKDAWRPPSEAVTVTRAWPTAAALNSGPFTATAGSEAESA
jgi:hypothetical protein